MHTKPMRLIIATLLMAALSWGCNNDGQSTPDGDTIDGDTVDQEPERDPEYPLCIPETLRCQEGNDEYLEKCNSVGGFWVLYKRCGLDERCEDALCVPRETDGDDDVVEETEEIEGEAGEQEEVVLDCTCPGHPEMARVVNSDTGEAYCIDRWEATVFENADCTGRVYGQAKGAWPEEFPNCIGCSDNFNVTRCMDFCSDEERAGDLEADLYPCSLSGAIPSHYISFFQAYFACMRVDKELCRKDTWIMQCSNNNQTQYPYGDEYIIGQCNERYNFDEHSGTPDLINTGLKEGCQTECGVYDLMGNVSEWVYYIFNENVSNAIVGSDYFYPQELYQTTCFSYDWLVPSSSEDNLGFRCCLPLAEE